MKPTSISHGRLVSPTLQCTTTILTAGLCLLSGVLGAGPAMGASPTPPTNLRVNDAIDPVGTEAKPWFGWFVNDRDRNEIQTKFQILVASTETKLNANTGDVWDSGQVTSRQQNHVVYDGKPLTSDTQYFWKVRTWDKDAKASRFSATGRFVAGPLSNPNWSGTMWIKRTNSAPDDYTYYRKKVALPGKAVARATVYISSAHKYALYVNGTLVGKGPAYHYPQYQYYNGYDITRLVTRNTTNLFAIFNHWFGGGQGRAPNERGVVMKAVIHYADGTSTVVGTDGTWRQSQATSWILGQPQYNSGEGIGYIERIDARNLIPTWNTPSFDDSSWSPATEIGAPPVDPWTNVLAPDLTRIVETELAPVSIADKGGGKYVIDLGKVYAGVPRITFSGGEAGTTINMLGGYALGTNGLIDTARNQQTDMRYFAVLNGGTFTYEPAEYLGMRYFQIDNSPMPVTPVNFRFIERHSEMGLTNSTFSSSDTTLNGVWDLMKHSLFTCAQESFLDTPTREKGGFLVDGAMQSIVAMPVTGERLLTQRALHQFLQSMGQYWSSDANRGRINAVYPNRDGGRDIPDFTQAYLAWVWEYYMETGDKRFLADGYAKFKDVGGYVQRHIDPASGLVTNLTGGSGPYIYGIIDWPANMRFGHEITTARTVINNLAYADFDILSKIAAELGNTADRDAYRQRADAIKSAINRHLISTNGVYIDGLNNAGQQSAHVSQHANMFPLALHLVPAANLGPVKDKVKELQMSVGMVTVLWLVRALGEADEGPALIELYTNPNWNGWARCLARGATATWESWFSDTDGTSESHAWGSAGLDGYVRYILGITRLKPQYEQIQIKPLSFGVKLSSAKGTVPTDRGEIAVEWTRESNRYVLKVNIPVNVTARVCVPKGTGTDSLVSVDGKTVTAKAEGNYLVIPDVGSGSHTFVRAIKP